MWLTNLRYLDADGRSHAADIEIDDASAGGTIMAVEKPSSGRAGAVDCTGLLAMPGLVNAHYHSQSTLLRGLHAGQTIMEWGDESPAGRIQQRLFDWLDNATPAQLEAVCRKEYLDLLRQGVTFVSDSGVSDLGGPPSAAAMDAVGLRGTVESYAATPPETPASGRVGFSVNIPPEEDLTEAAVADVRARRAAAPRAPLTGHCLETAHRRDLSLAHWNRSMVAVLADHDLLGPATVLYHCCLTEPEDTALIATSGATIAHCPVSNVLSSGRSGPSRQWLAAGARVALGTDWGDADMWGTARAAHWLLGTQGAPDASAAAAVLRMATSNGVVGYGHDDLGTVAVGHGADLALLDLAGLGPLVETDEVSTTAFAVLSQGSAALVRHVLVGGAWVLRDGVPTGVDAAATDRAYAELAAVAYAGRH